MLSQPEAAIAPLLGVLRKINPLTPQPVDRLSIPYLLFAADIDAPGDGDAALRAYTDSLWATMDDDSVTLRDRDTLDQTRIAISELSAELTRRLAEPWSSPKLGPAA